MLTSAGICTDNFLSIDRKRGKKKLILNFKLWKNIQKIDEPMCPKTRGYIVTIVEGRAIDMYRRKQRHPKYQLEEETAGMTVTYDDANVITRCISLLPVQDRQIPQFLQKFLLSITVLPLLSIQWLISVALTPRHLQ